MADNHYPLDRVAYFGDVDPALRGEMPFESPTLGADDLVVPILADQYFRMGLAAAAYDAAVYNIERLRRSTEGETDVPIHRADLPIGAAAGDGINGIVFQNFAQDGELGDQGDHAERMIIQQVERMKEDVGLDLGKLTLGVTLEPCPACFEAIARSELFSRVFYMTRRHEVEAIGILRPHDDKLPDLLRGGKGEESENSMDVFLTPDPKMQAACLELFRAYRRDLATGRIFFNPRRVKATRFAGFQTDMLASTAPGSHPRPEKDILIESFMTVLRGF